jgi:hypothetical protein
MTMMFSALIMLSLLALLLVIAVSTPATTAQAFVFHPAVHNRLTATTTKNSQPVRRVTTPTWFAKNTATATTTSAFAVTGGSDNNKYNNDHVAKTSAKQRLLDSLDDLEGFNKATKERTLLVEELTKENKMVKPGSTKGFSPFAVGTWRIIYAPHIYTMGSLVGGGSFDPVYYIMKPNGQMTSHARYSFPWLGSGWLSVSGTYGSEDEDRVCRVDFDKAWVTLCSGPDLDNNSSGDNNPRESLEQVPDSLSKRIIQTLGQLGFVKTVSVFPVSYLDNDTIVFDFELLGTRICARKIGPP